MRNTCNLPLTASKQATITSDGEEELDTISQGGPLSKGSGGHSTEVCPVLPCSASLMSSKFLKQELHDCHNSLSDKGQKDAQADVGQIRETTSKVKQNVMHLRMLVSHGVIDESSDIYSTRRSSPPQKEIQANPPGEYIITVGYGMSLQCHTLGISREICPNRKSQGINLQSG